MRAHKLPEQLELEREEDEAAAAAAAAVQRRAAQEAERHRRLADIRRRDAARQALQRRNAATDSGTVRKAGVKKPAAPAEALGKELDAGGRALLERARASVGPDEPIVVTLARSVVFDFEGAHKLRPNKRGE